MYYDQTRKDFKNRSLKTRVMDEKAKEMGLKLTLIWTWFKSMRTIYGKFRKRKSGQAAKPFTSRQHWTMTSFHFLDSHLTVCTKSRQLGAVGPSTEAQPEEIEVTSDRDSTTLLKKPSSLTKTAMIEDNSTLLFVEDEKKMYISCTTAKKFTASKQHSIAARQTRLSECPTR